MKRFAMILVAAATLIGGTGVAMAQHGGGGHGGGGMGGGGMGGARGGGGSGGAWHGGSGGGSWHGGSGWHGGSNWHGGHGWGWHGTSVVIGFGGPWWGWWPSYYPYYYGGYPYYSPYYGYPYYSYPYSSDGPMYDYGTYVQRPDAGYQGDMTQAPAQGGYQYYCPNPAGYYPQVPTCAAGWLRVVPPNAPGPTAPR